MTVAKRPLNACFLSGVAAFVALLPQFYLAYDRGNRYTMDWSSRDRASIWIAIGLLAAAYGLVYAGLRGVAGRLGKARLRTDFQRGAFDLALWILVALFFRTCMAIAFASAEMPEAVRGFIDLSLVKFAFYFLLPVGLLLGCRAVFEKAVVSLYRILAVLAVLFLAQSLAWETYSSDPGDSEIPADGAVPGPANSLFIFLFDEWSYAETFGNPQFSMADMPNLQELLGHSVLFRNAQSPGLLTTVSIPRFLFQADERAHACSHRELKGRIERNEFLDLGWESIFDLAPGHFKCVVGSYIHYAGIVRGHVDYVVPFYDHNLRYSVQERVLRLLYSQLAFLRRFGVAVPNPVEPLGWMWMEFQAQVRPVLNDLLPRLPGRTMAFFHICMPHGPFVFNRDWTRRDRPLLDEEDHDLAGYRENVYAIDVVIGDVVRLLKTRGDYDSSLIVLLSDHALKKQFSDTDEALDPLPNIPEKHVPLIIKYPGQTRGGESVAPIRTVGLHSVFRDYLNEPEKMARWVARWNAGEEPDPLYSPDAARRAEE